MKIQAIVQIAVTVDGLIAEPDGGVGFLDMYPACEGDNFDFSGFLDSIDVIIMGRNTFDMVVSFGEDMYAYRDIKMVVCSRDPSRVVIPEFLRKTVSASCETPRKMLQRLEDDGFRRAYVDGGITIQRFLREDCIHRLILTRVPLLLGAGIPLFANGSVVAGNDSGDGNDRGNGSGSDKDGNTVSVDPTKLDHIETKTYQNGLVTTTYDVKP